jgi:aspartate/glutamate racemase
LEGLGKKGVEVVVLACTDPGPLLEEVVVDGRVEGLRVVDWSIVHAEDVAEWALDK